MHTSCCCLFRRTQQLGHEGSFSLFETVIAVGMLAVILLYMAGIQGGVVTSLEYGQNMSKGMWLAKGIMAQMEYEWNVQDFSLMDRAVKDAKITDTAWGRGAAKTFEDFTYSITIAEWKLPLISFLSQGGSDGDGGGGGGGGGTGDLISQQMEAIFGGHILKIAQVEVFWPEGARRISTSLSLLLVNQRAVDAQIMTLKSPATPGLKSEPPLPLQQKQNRVARPKKGDAALPANLFPPPPNGAPATTTGDSEKPKDVP